MLAHCGARQGAVSDIAYDPNPNPRFSGPARSSERQQAVSGNVINHSAIRAGPQWWEDANSQWQYLMTLGYQGRPPLVRDSKQSVTMP